MPRRRAAPRRKMRIQRDTTRLDASRHVAQRTQTSQERLSITLTLRRLRWAFGTNPCEIAHENPLESHLHGLRSRSRLPEPGRPDSVHRHQPTRFPKPASPRERAALPGLAERPSSHQIRSWTAATNTSFPTHLRPARSPLPSSPASPAGSRSPPAWFSRSRRDSGNCEPP